MEGGGREVTIVKCLTNCPKTVSKKFADVCNQPTPKVHISLQKQLKVDDKIKINPCNHPTSKVLISLFTLKFDGVHLRSIWGTFEIYLRSFRCRNGSLFFWYDLALESKARFFASISSKHPFTSGFLIYTAKQWNDGSTMHFLVLQGLKLTVKQDYSPTYIFPFPKSSSKPIRYFHLFFAPFCDISSGPFQRSRNSLLPFLSYIFRVPYLLCDASVLSSRLVYSVKFLEGTVVNLFLQVNVDLRCRMVSWVYLDVLIYFELFLQVNMGLRCRIVTWFYLDVLIYFGLFLQVNLHLRCRMVTWI